MPTNIIITRTKAQRAEFQRLVATAKAPSHDAETTPTLVTEDIVVPPPKKKMGRPPKIKTNI